MNTHNGQELPHEAPQQQNEAREEGTKLPEQLQDMGELVEGVPTAKAAEGLAGVINILHDVQAIEKMRNDYKEFNKIENRDERMKAKMEYLGQTQPRMWKSFIDLVVKGNFDIVFPAFKAARLAKGFREALLEQDPSKIEGLGKFALLAGLIGEENSPEDVQLRSMFYADRQNTLEVSRVIFKVLSVFAPGSTEQANAIVDELEQADNKAHLVFAEARRIATTQRATQEIMDEVENPANDNTAFEETEADEMSA